MHGYYVTRLGCLWALHVLLCSLMVSTESTGATEPTFESSRYVEFRCFLMKEGDETRKREVGGCNFITD